MRSNAWPGLREHAWQVEHAAQFMFCGPVCNRSEASKQAACMQVAFTNSPRDLIGAAAKSLGLPLNFTARDMRACGVSESDLQDRLRAFRAQVLIQSSTIPAGLFYLEPNKKP